MSENNHGCSDTEVWDEDKGECVPKPTESVEASADNVLGKMENFLNDLLDQYTTVMTKKFDTMMQEKIKEAEIRFDQALRKTFGIDKDPVVHLSEIPQIMRKMALEGATGGKKTPASPGKDTGPEPQALRKARPKLDAIKASYGWGAKEAN